MAIDAKILTCRCGLQAFGVRANATHGVGLATCGSGHHSFLLDSRDVWTGVIQDGRPKELRCRCKSRMFSLWVDYSFREDARTVRAVVVRGRCAGCGADRAVFDADIDYEPTDELVHRSLDPVDDPWLKARRIELTGLWKPDDLERVLRYVGSIPDARIYLAGWRQPPRELDADGAFAAIHELRSYDLLLAPAPVTVPADLRDVWKRLPVVHLATPISMHYRTGDAELHYVTYAVEDVVAGKAVPRTTQFLEFADRVRSWLQSEFVSHRGRNTVDNPSEYQRLRGGW